MRMIMVMLMMMKSHKTALSRSLVSSCYRPAPLSPLLPGVSAYSYAFLFTVLLFGVSVFLHITLHCPLALPHHLNFWGSFFLYFLICFVRVSAFTFLSVLDPLVSVLFTCLVFFLKSPPSFVPLFSYFFL